MAAKKAAHKKKQTRKSVRKSGGNAPSTAMREKLCHEYLKDYNAYAAARRAGFSDSWARAKASITITKMTPFIKTLQTKKNDQMIMRGIMSQEEVLRGMSNIGRVNALDFISVKPAADGGVSVQLKDITELTREQADAITDVTVEGKRVTYKLPGVTEKMVARAMLAKHWGLTDPKLVQLRITQTIDMNADLRDVDSDKLAMLETQLVEALGPTAFRLLGYRPGEEVIEQPGPAEIADGSLEDEDQDEETR